MDTILPELPKPRDFKFGVGETLKFVRDVAEDFVKRRALVYTYIPRAGTERAFGNGPMILDEDELVQMQRGVTGIFIIIYNNYNPEKKKNLSSFFFNGFFSSFILCTITYHKNLVLSFRWQR